MSSYAQQLLENNRNLQLEKEDEKQQKQQQKVLQQQSSQPPPQKKYLPLPTKAPTFVKFSRWLAVPHYKGLYIWQKECDLYLNDTKYQQITVAREHGKSIYLGNKCQHKMQYLNYDVLYLGWTDRRKEVAQNICNFFEFNQQIQEKKSEYHFTIKNGGKFDCYLITSKDTLGMHSLGKQERFDNLTPEEIQEFKDLYKEEGFIEDGIFTEDILKNYVENKNANRKLLIVIDDPIDDSFMKELFKEEDLERRFMSTIYNINPDQWIFTGTRKFAGDFFDFIRKTFVNRLIEFNRGPYLREGETRYNSDLKNNPKNLTCPEKFTHPETPSYKQDLLDAKRDLDEIYHSLLNSGKVYWWYAEYWNDPHPIEGQVFNKIKTVDMITDPVVRNYDLCIIGLDRATTRQSEAHQKDADYTGCLIGLRALNTGILTITHDFTGYIDIDKLLLKINKFVRQFRLMHEHITIVLVVETQGGGSDFVTLIRNSVSFVDENNQLVNNYIREICGLIEIHNTGEKLTRIRDRLYAPITNKLVQLLSMLHGSYISNQILSFPNCEKFDAIDCLANMVFVLLEQYPTVKEGNNRIEELIKIYNDYSEGKIKDPLEDMNKSKFEFPNDEEWERRLGIKKNTKKYVFQ